MAKTKKLPGTRVEVYRQETTDRPNKEVAYFTDWRWRAVKNGRITHASCEGYTKFNGAMNNLRIVYVGALGPIVFISNPPRSRSAWKWWEDYALENWKGSRR